MVGQVRLTRAARTAAAILAAASGWAAATAGAAPPDADGGVVRVRSGALLVVHRSPVFAPDPQALRAWAEFFAGLPHGPEIETMSVYLASGPELLDTCGPTASACYSPMTHEIVVSGAQTLPGAHGGVVEDAARHEYGHHVAFAADNHPFPAGLGTKRWFSVMDVCRRVRRGVMVTDPAVSYERSAQEGFAEAYRVAVGGSPHRWIVADLFFPDPPAVRALLADVRRPWTGPRVTTLSGRIAKGASFRHRIATPLDGEVSVDLSGARVRATLEAGDRILARGRGKLSATVCGTRSVTLRVEGLRGSSRFRARVARP